VAVADTEVNASSPSTNFGKATAVGLDGSPVRVGYLLFNVSVPPGEVVAKATLKLFMTASSSANGLFVNQVSNTTWGETTTTYSNAPALGSQVAASGAFPANAYVSMDVTSLVSGNGLVSFAVRRSNTAAIAFSAREAASNKPQLVVESSDTSAPTVSMTAPASGSTVSGSAVTVSADASSNVVGVQFKLDGANLGSEDTSAPYTMSWDTTGVANGPHTLTAVARDAASNTATASDVTVTVSNITVSMSAPASGSTVSGSAVTISADASGNVGGVQFQLDGDPLGGEVTSAPYAISWDTTGVANGPHTLTAVARDAANNTATATPITVTVANPATSTFAPVADTEVNASSPTVNFGNATAIGLDGSPIRVGYLRFNVSMPAGQVVSKATLKLFMTGSSSADGLFVNQVSNTTWGETTTTYSNAPTLGAQVAASGAFPANAYVSMDVTSQVTGTGLVSFAVTRTNIAAIAFSARQAAANPPQLVVENSPGVPLTAPWCSQLETVPTGARFHAHWLTTSPPKTRIGSSTSATSMRQEPPRSLPINTSRSTARWL
jgi:hypothetical protein